MADTFTTLWNRLRTRCPALDPIFAQDIIRDCFNQLGERREWSWTMGHGAFYPPTYIITDTVSIFAGNYLVTSTGYLFNPGMIGKQIRIGGPGGIGNYPTYTIVAYVSQNQILIDQAWVGPSVVGAQYNIFQCYFPVPADFQYWISLVNSTDNYQLWTNLTQAELDRADPQRTQTGISYAAAFYDNTPNFSGQVGPTVQIAGSGASPVSASSIGYTFPANSVYTIQIILGGPSGTATFRWRQDPVTNTALWDEGGWGGGGFGGVTGWSPVIPTSTDVYQLSNGVAIYFPEAIYFADDYFIIQCTSNVTSSVARYEIWPRPINASYVYPYQYRKIPPALTDDQPQLPTSIANRGDVILEMGLERAASWPGTNTLRNAYYDLRLADRHYQKSERLIYELEKKDDDIAIKDLSYVNMPFYPAPWLDGSWLQSHAIYPNP